MKVWVVIPAYNEGYDTAGGLSASQRSLSALLSELKTRGLSTLVIDDGSSDNTFDIVKREAHIVIKNRANLGKGMALKKAVAYLLQNESFDYIITMDADGQHCPSDLDSFLNEAEKGASFVVGDRMGNPGGMPALRVITNKAMSWFISRIAKQKIPDTQCGFRLIKRDVLEGIRIRTNKFEIESEILIKAARRGFFIKSIPVKSIYFKNQRSKISPFVDTIRFVRFILELDREERLNP
ncbi:MAG: glycosyltransferase family 2 protein [Candidatus Omnitrophota bacterium]|nr:MAG: glycosyltransferase family 2 protein [Candidatus Omnitrophota bacterium]